MKVLVIGGGGREHALVWKLRHSLKVDKVYCFPGNAGIASHADCLPGSVEDVQGALEFAEKHSMDLTVVGPEGPLAKGIANAFEEKGFNIFGPSKEAAFIESSKSFAKTFMQRYDIPTAPFEVFSEYDKALEYVQSAQFPLVVKADGLAAGKGVIIAKSQGEAVNAVRSMMKEKVFGVAGEKVVIEKFLNGQEASVMAFSDGNTVSIMDAAQDHKRLMDNDEGPNTGGMGAYSSTPIVDEALKRLVLRKVLQPTINGLKKQGAPFKGVLYAGLMIDAKNQPWVLEFNARFGDPETQVVLPRMENDLTEVMFACVEGTLNEMPLRFSNQFATCVVAAAQGYPGNYEKGKPIQGLEEVSALPGVVVFHAGTTLYRYNVVTNGGRVLGVTGLGATLKESINRAYAGVEKISFQGMHYRKDIGRKALELQKA